MAPIYDPPSLVKNGYLQDMLKSCAATRIETLALVDRINTDLSSSPEDLETLSAEAEEAQRQLEALVAKLRGQNRKLAHLVRDTKAETGASRAEVDTLHLQLQNLYYEQRHLLGEISACENYDHSYMRLPMIPLEEFLEKHPEWNENMEDEAQGDGQIELMKARIQEEKKERMDLEEQRQALLKRKMELVRENAKRKEELTQLDKDLEKFIDAAQPIRKLFEKEY